ncbi:hypothetical protein MKW92_014356 [Papaver armeniacum]|nr:hypothetical protein MKW92_014356 [Papaver armeniacum]
MEELFKSPSYFSAKRVGIKKSDFGAPAHTCKHCGAIMWFQEKTQNSKTTDCEFSICCSSGQSYHKIGSLVPPENKEPGYNQLYICDTELAQEANRKNIFLERSIK